MRGGDASLVDHEEIALNRGDRHTLGASGHASPTKIELLHVMPSASPIFVAFVARRWPALTKTPIMSTTQALSIQEMTLDPKT